MDDKSESAWATLIDETSDEANLDDAVIKEAKSTGIIRYILQFVSCTSRAVHTFDLTSSNCRVDRRSWGGTKSRYPQPETR